MHFKIFNNNDNKYESMAKHMKGFVQGLYFILIIIIIIAIFHFIGYWDKNVVGNDYDEYIDNDVEYWNEETDSSYGIRQGTKSKSENKLYEQRQSDFGSKSLNEKDRERAEEEKKEEKKKSNNYLKK